MAKPVVREDSVEQLLKDLIMVVERLTIVTLGLQGVPQAKIRAVIGGDINRVNSILKHLKGRRK